jgi:hypothetical protein
MKNQTKKTITVSLDSAELATVLAALRYWQQDLEANGAEPVISEHFEDVKPLTPDQIDDLCERINCSPEPSKSKNKTMHRK